MGFFAKLFGKESVEGLASGVAGKAYQEKDNRGMRIENESQSMAYWMGERLSKTLEDPFVYYLFHSEADARAALLELPFLHEAGDSGKLICDEVFTFGYYQTSSGQVDAFVAGADLTRNLWERLHTACEKHGGAKKNDLEPRAAAKPSTSNGGNAKKVKFLREDRANGATYRTYRGGSKADALAFLAEQNVTQREYYLVVETPEGNFGKDIQGFYQE